MRFLIGLIAGSLLAGMLNLSDSYRHWLSGHWQQLSDAAASMHMNTVTQKPEAEDQVRSFSEAPEALLEKVTEVEPDVVSDQPAYSASIEAPLSEPDLLERATANEIEQAQFQAAWIPFHSERSALGFADKLESQLQHHFRVVRVGPGKYEVGFDYASDSQRLQMLDAISAVTGYQQRGDG